MKKMRKRKLEVKSEKGRKKQKENTCLKATSRITNFMGKVEAR